MHSKEIIKWNNELRHELTEENKKIYENILIYIRTASNKSEEQTEGVLLELLEHIIQAQKEGKTPTDIFGDDLKAYCNQVIKEIPGEERPKRVSFGIFIAIQYIAIICSVWGLLGFGLHYFFDLGSSEFTFSLGSSLVVLIVDLLLIYLFIKIIMKSIRNSVFKNRKAWKEFILLWVFCLLYFALFYFTPKLIPSFGPSLTIPILVPGIMGVIIYIITFFVNRKIRLV